jgi:O-6-methylguanine DNA methyltransferase
MEIVHTARIESPIGALRLASSARGLAFLELPHASGRGLAGWLERAFPGARCREDAGANRRAVEQVLEYLEGERTAFELPLDLRGTEFQLRVWTVLRGIPYGETRSYTEVARSVARPRAVRAVGSANGANPLPLVVPCHRVVESGGRLGGYGGGLPLKAKLLAMERAGRPAQGCLL